MFIYILPLFMLTVKHTQGSRELKLFILAEIIKHLYHNLPNNSSKISLIIASSLPSCVPVLFKRIKIHKAKIFYKLFYNNIQISIKECIILSLLSNFKMKFTVTSDCDVNFINNSRKIEKCNFFKHLIGERYGKYLLEMNFSHI